MKKVLLPLSAFLFFALFLIGSADSYSQGVIDPPSLPVYTVGGPITVDGQLTEGSWAYIVPHLKFRANGTVSGQANVPTGGATVKEVYKDTSTCYVKFLRDGMKLYISLNSDDKQVCRFGDSWEGDGIFMKIKNGANQDVEYKLYYNLGGVNPDIHYEGPSHGMGAGYKKPGTTVNDSSNVDAGYTAELMIRLDSLGYTSNVTSVQVMINIFDPDNYSDGVGAWGANGNYYKQWWGSEWGSAFRTLNLMNTVVPVELTSFTAAIVNNNIELAWSTATETNNRGFEIQRSLDNSEFVTIGFVNGKGTYTENSNYIFTDTKVGNGNYSYRLKQIDYSGEFNYSNVIEIEKNIPSEFKLESNYPNPFNPTTNISFSLPIKSNITLSVFNALGQLVSVVTEGMLDAGNHKFSFDAQNLTSGIYFYNLNAQGIDGKVFSSTGKMTLLK